MRALLLSLHVVASIVLIGPITVTASVFPRYARAALPEDASAGPAAGPLAVAVALRRITRGYAVPALVVPVLGIGTANALGVLGDTWVLVSIGLTAVGGLVLARAVVPLQQQALDALAGHPVPEAGLRSGLARLSMVTGGFGLVWVAVVVLMIVRPGSTTGV